MWLEVFWLSVSFSLKTFAQTFAPACDDAILCSSCEAFKLIWGFIFLCIRVWFSKQNIFMRQHLGRRLKLQSPLLSAECLNTFINSSSIAAYVADPFISQIPGNLFTVSSEAFDSVTEESDKALALSGGKTDEQEKSSFSLCLHNWSTHKLKEFAWSHRGNLWQTGNLASLRPGLRLRIQRCKYTTSWTLSAVVPRKEAACACAAVLFFL